MPGPLLYLAFNSLNLDDRLLLANSVLLESDFWMISLISK